MTDDRLASEFIETVKKEAGLIIANYSSTVAGQGEVTLLTPAQIGHSLGWHKCADRE